MLGAVSRSLLTPFLGRSNLECTVHNSPENAGTF